MGRIRKYTTMYPNRVRVGGAAFEVIGALGQEQRGQSPQKHINESKKGLDGWTNRPNKWHIESRSGDAYQNNSNAKKCSFAYSCDYVSVFTETINFCTEFFKMHWYCSLNFFSMAIKFEIYFTTTVRTSAWKNDITHAQ